MSSGGWFAPIEVLCSCGSTAWPHRCPLLREGFAEPLDLPTIRVRRDGVSFPDAPTHPVVTVRRLTVRNRWGWRRWMWTAYVPASDDGAPAWSHVGGHRPTARGAARAGRRHVARHSPIPANVTIHRDRRAA